MTKIKEILILLCSFLLLFVLFFHIFMAFLIQEEAEKDYIAPENVKFAMKYHGVLSAESQNGVYFFYRNGKKCPLFTEKEIKAYENYLKKD